FLALYLNLERIDPPEKLLPFLYRVSRNCCYDILRKRERRQIDSLDVYEDNLPEKHLSVEDKTHWRLLYAEVREAIQQLPEVQRQTMMLYIEEHLTYSEIADIMHTEIGTVKSRMYHARKVLRGTLHPDILMLLTDKLS
ncbi:MAG: RNA polymerase sigma factor, partial [Aggregatilineales bacterium]